jgi:aspartyl-tRNA(Asn)/glutamyl-tRNA(Gln) amidotransferase subunit A
MTLRGKTIEELGAALAAGRVTSRALVEAALESIARDGTAFTRVAAEQARADADHADRMRKFGVAPSPLAGIPVSVKDLFDVAGETTPAGSAILREASAAARDAPVIARLRAAGAVIVGRTHMSEFAFHGIASNPHLPRCANPHDAARVPGGSSSGAAVSVVRGQAAMGLGTDTGGSTRVPAAFCGIVGFKPTQRRVTREGAFPLSETLDSVGPLANSVRCCAETDRIIADAPTPVHPPLGVAGLRFAAPKDLVLDDMDAVVSRAFERALGALGAAGARIEHVAVPPFARMPQIYARGTIANAEAFRFHTAAKLLAQRDRYDPNVLARIEIGGRISAADYIDLLHARAETIREVDRITAPYDALIFPTSAIVAPRFDEVAEPQAFTKANTLALRNCMTVNFTDRCALSVPMHREGELPTGLMIVGETMGDARLFAIGEAVEGALNDGLG